MSPILVRPVREQFEHDRVIRVLQARYQRKYEVAINPGAEQNSPVEAGEQTMFPDLVLFSDERSKRLQGTVEVETGESVTTLEAMAQWGPFSRLRAPFFLYVPPNALDAARRLCNEYNIEVDEIWTYHTAVDQVRFTMVHKAPQTPAKMRAAEKAERAWEQREAEARAAEAKAAAQAEKLARAEAKAEKERAAKAEKAEKAATKAASAKAPPKPVQKAAARPSAKSAARPPARAAAKPAARSAAAVKKPVAKKAVASKPARAKTAKPAKRR